jgi:hypothetical protein
MPLSKLQKLDPSAIDKCRLWPVKKEEIEAFLTPLRNLQTPFTNEE